MLARPYLITRRAALVSGAAALAMMPRDARAAPSITWNSSDKSANITLSKGSLMAENTGTAGYASVRATGSASSGKKYCELQFWNGSPASGTMGFGNSSASLSAAVGGNANGVGTEAAGNLYYNNSNISSWPSTSQEVRTLCLALDLDNKKIWGRYDGGTWYGASGSSGNPATNTNGADITTLVGTGALFPMVSPWKTRMYKVYANFGFYTWLFGVPSGFGGWDSAAPVTNANGGYPLASTVGATYAGLINNGLTTVGNGTSTSTQWDTFRMSAAIPPSSKVMVSWRVNAVSNAVPVLSSSTGGNVCGFVRSTSTLTGSNLGSNGVFNSVGFLGSGLTILSNGAGSPTTLGTTEIYTTPDDVDMCIDMVNSTMWTRVNGGNWNNSGAANPSTNTGGYSFSTIAGASLYVAQSTNLTSAMTLNTGVDTFPYSVPSGFTSLYAALLAQGGARSRGFIVQ